MALHFLLCIVENNYPFTIVLGWEASWKQKRHLCGQKASSRTFPIGGDAVGSALNIYRAWINACLIVLFLVEYVFFFNYFIPDIVSTNLCLSLNSFGMFWNTLVDFPIDSPSLYTAQGLTNWPGFQRLPSRSKPRPILWSFHWVIFLPTDFSPLVVQLT